MRTLLLSCSLILAACSSAPPSPTKILQTPQGPVQGIFSSDNAQIASYQGVPFAAAPVGELRWAPPAAAPTWTEVRAADQFGTRCMQATDTEGGFFERLIDGHGLSAIKSFAIKRVVAAMDPPPVSEDCLYLNVRTAVTAKDAPVMVWIHGGGHQFGSSDFDYYQADALAEAGVVAVSLPLATLYLNVRPLPARELIEAGVPGIHFYIMSTARHVVRVAEPLRRLVG